MILLVVTTAVVEVRVGDIVDFVTRTREGHVTGQAISQSRVTSGLTSLTV